MLTQFYSPILAAVSGFYIGNDLSAGFDVDFPIPALVDECVP